MAMPLKTGYKLNVKLDPVVWELLDRFLKILRKETNRHVLQGEVVGALLQKILLAHEDQITEAYKKAMIDVTRPIQSPKFNRLMGPNKLSTFLPRYEKRHKSSDANVPQVPAVPKAP